MLKRLIEERKEKIRETYLLGRIIAEKIRDALCPYVKNIWFRMGGSDYGGMETITFFNYCHPNEKDKFVSVDDLLNEISDEVGYSFQVIDLVEGFCYPIFDFRECYVPKDVAGKVKEVLKLVLFGEE